MTYLKYGFNGKYIRIKDPTWEQVYDAILSRHAEAPGLYDRGLVFSTDIVMTSLASITEHPERVLLRLSFKDAPYYRILDLSLEPYEDDDHYVEALDCENELVQLHHTILKSEAIEILYRLYHENTLPPKDRWVACYH